MRMGRERCRVQRGCSGGGKCVGWKGIHGVNDGGKERSGKGRS